MGKVEKPSQPISCEEFLHNSSGLTAKPLARWQKFVEQLPANGWSYQSCRDAWQAVFEDQAQETAPCWVPTQTCIQNSNIQSWCNDLGIADVESFHQWSVQNRQEFWDQAFEALEIAFREEPSCAFDLSQSNTTPKWMPGSRLNIVESCFQTAPDQVAVISGDPLGNLTFYSYGELRSRINQISNGLIELGFVAGDRIGIVMPMTFESIAIYLGIIQAGMVVVSIADSFAPPEISSRLEIADAKAVISYQTLTRSGKNFDLGERVRKATDLPIFLVDAESNAESEADSVVDTEAILSGDRPTVWWHELINRQPEQFEPAIGDPHDPVNILFSSGTTGTPKAIPWNHATPIKCAVDGHLHQDLHPGDVVAWPTNLGWMMGPWLIFATLINKGTIAVYDDAPFGAGFGKFVQDAKVNMLGLVPSMVRVWKTSGSMEPFDWSSIHCFSSTGEASNAENMFYLSWLGQFKPIIEYCGGTEIGGGYISSTVVQPNIPATFSTVSFGLDVEILDEQGQPASAGELFIVPPSIGLSIELLNRDHDFTYYADCPTDSNGNRLRRHGDFFSRLPNGYFVAGGRTDDTMNLGGIKISSVEIEQVINQLAEVSESAAVAVPMEGTGPDQLVVFIVRSELEQDGAARELLQEMNGLLREKLNPLFKIQQLVFKNALPRTASNKVMRRLLRDELIGGSNR